MDAEQLALKLQETTDRSHRNEGRIKKLEEKHKTLEELTTAVAVMAEQLKTMNKSVNTITSKVDDLESKPVKRWDSVVNTIIGLVVGAVIAFLLGKIGL
jgi:uncharacterized protein YoxC